jgi:SAM-dependent methyltransferase
MATIEQNQKEWGNSYGWPQDGDEWSQGWGGAAMHWYGSLLPRIHSFVPAQTILEIAPGYGRWTQFLLGMCLKLHVVDLNANCIARCQQRFANVKHITYHQNDGKDLSMIPDGSIDFVFSFDSLVHAEADVMQAYLLQLASKLRPDGVGFIHHSNIGEFVTYFDLVKNLKAEGNEVEKLQLINAEDNDHWRARSMTAGLFRTFCEMAGLSCVAQEMVNWGTKRTIDAFSVFTRKGSRWDRPLKIQINDKHMQESEYLRQLALMYHYD